MLTHSIFTVSPFLTDSANGISGCHRLCNWGCFSAGMSNDTSQMLRISVRPMFGLWCGERIIFDGVARLGGEAFKAGVVLMS